MSISDKFPVTFTKYEETIKFSNPDEKQKLIGAIAEKVASIYASFLTKEGTEKRSKELALYCKAPTEFPPKEMVDKFRINLAADLIKNLNGDKDEYTLSTDYAPEKSLAQVFASSGIEGLRRKISEDLEVQIYPASRYFPFKTKTMIKIDSKLSCINIKMRSYY
jgi:hypothetical protein